METVLPAAEEERSQRIRSALIHHMPPLSLDDQRWLYMHAFGDVIRSRTRCRSCGGDGVVGGVACECVAEVQGADANGDVMTRCKLVWRPATANDLGRLARFSDNSPGPHFKYGELVAIGNRRFISHDRFGYPRCEVQDVEPEAPWGENRLAIGQNRERPAIDIESTVCCDILARQQLGIAKYGQTVSQNPLELREWLQHAYEECLDQAVYLRRAMAELTDEGSCCDSGGVSSTEHDSVEALCAKLEVATKLLKKHYEDMCPSDSYGVPGSDFSTCSECGAGGAPTIPLVHAESCSMQAVEAFLYGY